MTGNQQDTATLTRNLLLQLSAKAINATADISQAKLRARSQEGEDGHAGGPSDRPTDKHDDRFRRALRLRQKLLELDRQSRQKPPLLGQPFRHAKLSAFVTHSFQVRRKEHMRKCIRAAADGMEIATLSGDEGSGPGTVRALLIDQVYQRINEAHIYLALLTPSTSNPEAPSAWELVEIGMAIACQKPIVLVAHTAVKKYCLKVFQAYGVLEFDDYDFYDQTKFKGVISEAFLSAERLLLTRAEERMSGRDN